MNIFTELSRLNFEAVTLFKDVSFLLTFDQTADFIQITLVDLYFNGMELKTAQEPLLTRSVLGTLPTLSKYA